jgi:hypothetical protein
MATYNGDSGNNLIDVYSVDTDPTDDDLFGDDGNDTLNGGLGNNTIDGGNGIDTIDYSWLPAADGTGAGVTVDLDGGTGHADDGTNITSDTLVSIENVIGSQFNDNIYGNDSSNVLDGGDGDDYLHGSLNEANPNDNDTLLGGDGDDTLLGGAGNDSLDGGAGANDYAVFEDPFASYTFAYNVGLGRWTITNTITGDTDILHDIEFLEFSGGVVKTYAEVACFLRGTRVLTRAGYVPVESLRPGDEVQTLKHGWRPVQWLGQRHIPRNATGGSTGKSSPSASSGAPSARGCRAATCGSRPTMPCTSATT